MRSLAINLPFSLVSLTTGAVMVLAVIYVGLIATVMSYATLTVGFSQSVKNDEAALAILEGQYLSSMARIESLDYSTEGYTRPLAKIFVPATGATAVR